ncbi:MAG: Methylenetetrahydrofolate--tRNA-(uracil-5-)-methyltransferase TrmFO [Candidatus Aminicenantes bacterium ADurb.Bin508]|nr:MAG: Methylenetetrahydrofolate--tRNA-(uracil-5-)-methyltransferase TrmFO [Candidatus Aminicenantes bacterium ADurb.Bin508]
MSPIVLAETLDFDRVFRASRWGRGRPQRATPSATEGAPDGTLQEAVRDEVTEEDGDYLNCPFDEAGYRRFYEALMAAERAPLHDFEEGRFFEGASQEDLFLGGGIGCAKPFGKVFSVEEISLREDHPFVDNAL